MKVNKQEDQLLKKAIDHWSREGWVTAEQAEQLLQSYEVSTQGSSFDWKNLSLIAFFFAVSCIILATILLLLDDWLMAMLDSLLNTSDLTKFLFFVALTGGLYYLAFRRKQRYPTQVFSNETLFMFGAIGVAFSLTYLSFVLGIAEGYFAILILLASLVYAGLAIYLRSKLTWFLALGTLAVWFGTETAYRSGWEAYFMGMNFPLRYVIFGALLLGLSMAFQRIGMTRPFASLTYTTGTKQHAVAFCTGRCFWPSAPGWLSTMACVGTIGLPPKWVLPFCWLTCIPATSSTAGTAYTK